MGIISEIAVPKEVVMQLIIAAPLIWLCGVAAYRLWFHPLAKYPGPLLGRLTHFYGAYYTWKGAGHLHMQQCHEKYGDFVRYGPDRLLVNSTTGMKSIYSHSKDFQKSERYNVMVHRAPNTLTAIDKKSHGRKRRILSQGLSEAALRSYEPIVLEQINKMCDIWAGQADPTVVAEKRGWSIPQNMAKWANYLTFDIMSAVIFGQTFNLLSKEDNRFVPEAIEASNVRTSMLIQQPKFMFRRWDRKLFQTSIVGRNRFIKFVTGLLQQRMARKPTSQADAFSFLLKAKDPETGESFTPAELGAEATTLVVAGSDTSSTALAAFFFYMSRHPAAYARAAAEVRAAFPTGTPVGLGAALNSCTFLAACIDEAMRLCPPAATALWRQTNAPVLIDGRPVPAGVDVGTCVYAIHHNEAYFPNAFTFQPERFLPENRTADAQTAYNPFSVGPRSCIGKGLAKIELMLTGATVLSRFDFEIAPGQAHVGAGAPALGWRRERPEEYQMFDHITCAKEGPVLRFRERTVASE